MPLLPSASRCYSVLYDARFLMCSNACACSSAHDACVAEWQSCIQLLQNVQITVHSTSCLRLLVPSLQAAVTCLHTHLSRLMCSCRIQPAWWHLALQSSICCDWARLKRLTAGQRSSRLIGVALLLSPMTSRGPCVMCEVALFIAMLRRCHTCGTPLLMNCTHELPDNRNRLCHAMYVPPVALVHDRSSCTHIVS